MRPESGFYLHRAVRRCSMPAPHETCAHAMERKPRNVEVEPLRKTTADQYEMLRRKLARWADHKEAIRTVELSSLDSLHDRANENWFALLAIAQVAGEQWKKKALAYIAALDLGEEDDGSTVTAL